MLIPQITQDYDYEIAKETLPVVVEFYAVWCPNCALMKAIVEQVALRNQETLVFKKADVDQLKDTADYLGIEIVPTFVVYRQGEILGYTSGVLSMLTLEERIIEMV